MKKELKFEIIQNIGVISEKTKGWKKELNLISWNNAEPKYDIRDWDPEHRNMGKGTTLTEEELKSLYTLLGNKLFSLDNDNTMSDVDEFLINL